MVGIINQQLEPQRNPLYKVVATAIFLYCVSQVKFFVRDPLARETGFQGPIELLTVVASSLLMLYVIRRLHTKIIMPPAAKIFLVFGVLAAFSSVYSFDPRISGLKAFAFFLVCGIAVTACSVLDPMEVLRIYYHSVICIVVVGSALKLVTPEPLFETDEYSGRARFSVFGWDPGALADICALTILVGMLLPRRVSIYLQALLFGVNIIAGARTSTALLVAVLLVVGLTRIPRESPRTLSRWSAIAFGIALVIGAGILLQDHLSPRLAKAAESLYGIRLGEDMGSLNGRTEVWHVAAPLISQCTLLGYGLEGARDILVSRTSWNAGHSHNSIIELILTGGIPAMLIFLFGWAASAKRALEAPLHLRIRIFALYAYIAFFGMTEPNLTYLQAVAVFFIITLDSKLYQMTLHSARQNSLRKLSHGQLTRFFAQPERG